MELKRIYGVRHGNNQFDRTPNVSESSPTQKDLAAQMGVSVDTLNNYKKLTQLIPELEDLVDTGIVTPTTALSLLKRLSPEEQEDFISSMDVTKRITKKQADEYV